MVHTYSFSTTAGQSLILGEPGSHEQYDFWSYRAISIIWYNNESEQCQSYLGEDDQLQRILGNDLALHY